MRGKKGREVGRDRHKKAGREIGTTMEGRKEGVRIFEITVLFWNIILERLSLDYMN